MWKKAFLSVVDPLPENWFRATDVRGQEFFHNSVTCAVTYERPQALPDGWLEARDPKTQELYFYNWYTRDTLPWDEPPGGVIVPQPAPVPPPNGDPGSWPKASLSVGVVPDDSQKSNENSSKPPVNSSDLPSDRVEADRSLGLGGTQDELERSSSKASHAPPPPTSAPPTECEIELAPMAACGP
eukprot:CAMPEP_0119302908 /NCGR_PEP_ID=MMETSP1333-20130426/4432_1 /TAXON_ID=418940 /ORGANISM="Scyphosphaera apsteinii, Strain RCC1455" /LENGTH=183 /DNA_ID=CAMNT_0007305427 /DNA_START=20 /DNA_END=571 /DNA_ORIENTATION=+